MSFDHGWWTWNGGHNGMHVDSVTVVALTGETAAHWDIPDTKPISSKCDRCNSTFLIEMQRRYSFALGFIKFTLCQTQTLSHRQYSYVWIGNTIYVLYVFVLFRWFFSFVIVSSFFLHDFFTMSNFFSPHSEP